MTLPFRNPDLPGRRVYNLPPYSGPKVSRKSGDACLLYIARIQTRVGVAFDFSFPGGALFLTSLGSPNTHGLVYRLRASAWLPGDWGFIPGRVTLKTLTVFFAASRQALGTSGSAKG